MGKFVDLSGQRFNKLLLLKRMKDSVSPGGSKHAMYLCRCDCGNEKIIAAVSILSGRTKSCGCLNKEAGLRKRIQNHYDLSGEYGIGYTQKGEPFYFDLEDYDKIKDYCWKLNEKGYVVTRRGDKSIRLHKFLLNTSGIVDHKDGNPQNNQKNNLRPASISQNTWNRHNSPHNKIGVMGVSFDKSRGKWMATLKAYNTYLLHKRYVSIEDAIKARLEAEAKYFGEFAPQQYLFKQYGIEIQTERYSEEN